MAFGKKNDDPYARRDYSQDSDPYSNYGYDADNPYARHYDEESDNIYARHFDNNRNSICEVDNKTKNKADNKTSNGIERNISKSDENYAYRSDDPYARHYDPSSDNIYKKHFDNEGNEIDNDDDTEPQKAQTPANVSGQSNTVSKLTQSDKDKLERLKRENYERLKREGRVQKNDTVREATKGVTDGVKREITTEAKKDVYVNLTSGSEYVKKVILLIMLFYFLSGISVVASQVSFDVQLPEDICNVAALIMFFAVFIIVIKCIYKFSRFARCSNSVEAVCVGNTSYNGTKKAVIEYVCDKNKYKIAIFGNGNLPKTGEKFEIKVNPSNPEDILPSKGSVASLIYSVMVVVIVLKIMFLFFGLYRNFIG
jgi:hypothetical protein